MFYDYVTMRCVFGGAFYLACNSTHHLKVEPYSIHGSFLKLEYLKTEFNEDTGTYAIVKVTSHSYRIMVNLSINDYYEVMQHTLRTYLDVFRFLAKCQDLPFT